HRRIESKKNVASLFEVLEKQVRLLLHKGPAWTYHEHRIAPGRNFARPKRLEVFDIEIFATKLVIEGLKRSIPLSRELPLPVSDGSTNAGGAPFGHLKDRATDCPLRLDIGLGLLTLLILRAHLEEVISGHLPCLLVGGYDRRDVCSNHISTAQ